MSVPGLKAGVELEEQPTPRLVHRESGNSLVLSETEVLLLKAWDGSTSATRLSAAVFMHGVDVEAWQVEQFFVRLERAELLAAEKPSVPNFVGAQSGVDAPEDVVPALRADLVVTHPEGTRGTLQVKDPLTERSFSLYDFEVSIARMLDGKRTAADVIAASGKLGIPVTLATLKTFIAQLKAYRFIDQDVKGGDSTWSKRTAWTDEVRQLYQGALRMMRHGKFEEALSYVEAMTEADPQNAEAQDLRLRIEEEARGSHALRVDFEKLHTPAGATPAVVPLGTTKDETGPFASFGFHSQPPAPTALPPIPPEIEQSVARTPTLVERLKKRKGAVAGGSLGLVALILLLRPVPVTQSVACELQLEQLGVPKTARGGKVGEKVVALGATVAKGAVLARLGGDSLEEFDAKVKSLQTELAAVSSPVTGKKVDAATAALKKAQAALAALEKKGKKAPKAQLKAKQKAVESARAALDKLTHEAEKAKLESELKALATRRVGLVAELEKSIVVAPAAGVFVSVGPLPEELGPNGAYGLVVAPNFTLQTKEPPIAGALSGVFHAAGRDADVQIVDGKAVLAVVPALVGAKGTLELQAGHQPWLLSKF